MVNNGFFNARLLRDHKTFHEKYELPIIHGGTEGELAQIKLKRKLHPFFTKKIEKTCRKRSAA